MASIDTYRKYVLSRKFTQNPSHYVMTISPGVVYDESRSEAFTCYPDSILLPGRNFINTPFAYFGPEFTVPLRREYNELSINFIIYQDWKERDFFEKWMNSILPFSDIKPGMQTSDSLPPNLVLNLRNIELLFKTRSGDGSEDFKPAYKFKFIDCYPLLITPSSFSSDNSGYTLFTVNFAYKYYINEQYQSSTPNSISL